MQLTSINIDKTIARGGTRIEVTGDFSDELGRAIYFYVGPNGNDTDSRCLSGTAGNIFEIFPLNETKLVLYTPSLAVGGPYHIFGEREDGVDDDLLSGVLTIVESYFNSFTFTIRSVLPPFYKTGPRNMDLLEGT